MNVKILVFVICVEAIIYLLLYNLHDCTFKRPLFLHIFRSSSTEQVRVLQYLRLELLKGTHRSLDPSLVQ